MCITKVMSSLFSVATANSLLVDDFYPSDCGYDLCNLCKSSRQALSANHRSLLLRVSKSIPQILEESNLPQLITRAGNLL